MSTRPAVQAPRSRRRILATILLALGAGGAVVLGSVVAISNEAPDGAPPVAQPPQTPTTAPPSRSVAGPVPSVSVTDRRRATAIALRDPNVARLLGGWSNRVAIVATGSAGSEPDIELTAVVIAFEQKVPFPAGVPTLVTRREGDPPLPLADAVGLSKDTGLTVDSITVLVDFTRSRVFAIDPGGLPPQN